LSLLRDGRAFCTCFEPGAPRSFINDFALSALDNLGEVWGPLDSPPLAMALHVSISVPSPRLPRVRRQLLTTYVVHLLFTGQSWSVLAGTSV
jgi:hypothetical protein